jgi:hypothetical protein
MDGVYVLLLAVACMPAWAVPTCTVASSATLSFGTIVALASTGDMTTNSGTSRTSRIQAFRDGKSLM